MIASRPSTGFAWFAAAALYATAAALWLAEPERAMFEHVVVVGAACLLGVAALASVMRARRRMQPAPGPAQADDAVVLFHASPVPALLVDASTLRVIDANHAAAALYGFAREQAVRLVMRDLLVQPKTKREAAVLEPRSGVHLHRRADGTTIDVETSVERTTFRGREVWFVSVRDVTARLQLQRALEASERRFREMVELSLGLMFVHDERGRIVMANQAMAHAIGYEPHELEGRDLADLITTSERPFYKIYLERVLTVGHAADSGTLFHRNGDERVWEYRNQLHVGADGVRHVLCCAIDVTERRSYERELAESSRTDPLTGSHNRRHLARVSRLAGEHDRWGCIVVDIDHFKHYNDTHGHSVGDRILVETVQFLRGLVRGEDAIVRLGGDEFLILLAHYGSNDLEAFVERLQATTRAGAPVPLSFGWASREASETLEQTVHRADQMLIRRRATVRGRSRPRDLY
ncbi:sensor domain-containing diguanylate cyclase [Dokdonella sp. MW10]|uniref:sensor domain-containing diguanylate cyclase n=1 Tax=Dokdonella sp. MW10 TaxID=2992926 RepID=UPI003F7FC02B